jgi:hypothetical protein
MQQNNKRRKTPDVLELLNKLNRESKQLLSREIIAPLLPQGRIRTRIAGMVYEFKCKGEFSGWGRFSPLNEREASPLEEAQPWERGLYLEQLPALRVILLWPDPDPRHPGTWWALPYNQSDARQRFKLNVEPLPVFLCDPGNGAERFERVLVRVDGNALWFEGPDILADPTHAEWLRDTATDIERLETFLPGLSASERLALVLWQMRQVELALPATVLRAVQHSSEEPARDLPREAGQQREWLHQQVQQRQFLLYEQAQRGTLEHLLRHALTRADARLHGFSMVPATNYVPAHLVVEWSAQGQTHRYRSMIDPNMTVISSGICLSGRDRDFDLTSLVNVMTDAYWE